MDKININLIPPEIKEKEKKEARQSWINRVSVAFLGILILATSAILAVVIFQGASLNLVNSEIERERIRIQSNNDAEAVVWLLRNRVDTINDFTTKKYRQKEVLDLLTRMFPPGIDMRSISINRTQNIIVQSETTDTLALWVFFENLTDPKTNEGKIASVTVDSLNRTKAGRINIALTIHLEAGVI